MTRRRLDVAGALIEGYCATRDTLARLFRGPRCPVCWDHTRNPHHATINHPGETP